MMIFPIYGKVTNVPDHQPATVLSCSIFWRTSNTVKSRKNTLSKAKIHLFQKSNPLAPSRDLSTLPVDLHPFRRNGFQLGGAVSFTKCVCVLYNDIVYIYYIHIYIYIHMYGLVMNRVNMPQLLGFLTTVISLAPADGRASSADSNRAFRICKASKASKAPSSSSGDLRFASIAWIFSLVAMPDFQTAIAVTKYAAKRFEL
jgi:hypothetical protein